MYNMCNEYGDVVLNFSEEMKPRDVLIRLSYVRGTDWNKL